MAPLRILLNERRLSDCSSQLGACISEEERLNSACDALHSLLSMEGSRMKLKYREQSPGNSTRRRLPRSMMLRHQQRKKPKPNTTTKEPKKTRHKPSRQS